MNKTDESILKERTDIQSSDYDQLLQQARQKIARLEQEKQALIAALTAHQIPVPEGIENPVSRQLPKRKPVYAGWQNENQMKADLSLFFSLFRGRKDVYAAKGKKGNRYFPQCGNAFLKGCPKADGDYRFNCFECENQAWKKLGTEALRRHFHNARGEGTAALAIYPRLPYTPDPLCKLLVWTFKEDAAQTDLFKKEAFMRHADALEKICQDNGIFCLKERFFGGARIWIFFEKMIPVHQAREFARLLLMAGRLNVSVESFREMDWLQPDLDPGLKLGEAVALPLSAWFEKEGKYGFAGEDWKIVSDPMERLRGAEPLSEQTIVEKIRTWKDLEQDQKMLLFRPEPGDLLMAGLPWDLDSGDFHLLLDRGIAIRKAGLSGKMCNQLRALGCYENPVWKENVRRGYSNRKTPQIIELFEEENAFIRLPRGLLSKLEEKVSEKNLQLERDHQEGHLQLCIEDERSSGCPLPVSFSASLYPEQRPAFRALARHSNGILKAATGFGKTVISAALIAEHQVSTLIIVDKTDLAAQWEKELMQFLRVEEDLLTAELKAQIESGKLKGKRRGGSDLPFWLGRMYGGKSSLSGLVDIVLSQSLSRKMDSAFFNRYGMVIYDECHHAASETGQAILAAINSRYVYGVSATPERTDQLDRSILMSIGPIRYEYTEQDKADARNLYRHVEFCPTSFKASQDEELTFSQLQNCLYEDEARNAQIVRDVRAVVKEGRTPMVLTQSRAHARCLKAMLDGAADHLFLLYGEQSLKENQEAVRAMKELSDDESMILIATGQKAGEGFSFSRLDTLFLTCPVASGPLLTQYTGRLDRPYPGKTELRVYDYADVCEPMLKGQIRARRKQYAANGWEIDDLVQTEGSSGIDGMVQTKLF